MSILNDYLKEYPRIEVNFGDLLYYEQCIMGQYMQFPEHKDCSRVIELYRDLSTKNITGQIGPV